MISTSLRSNNEIGTDNDWVCENIKELLLVLLDTAMAHWPI